MGPTLILKVISGVRAFLTCSGVVTFRVTLSKDPPPLCLQEHLSSDGQEVEHLAQTKGTPASPRCPTSHNFVLPLMLFPAVRWGTTVLNLKGELLLCGHKEKGRIVMGGQQLLHSACLVALNILPSQQSVVMWRLSPSLTYSSRKFPHEFTT